VKIRLLLPWLPIVLVGQAGLIFAQPAAKSANLSETSLEIAALQILHDLELAPGQLSELSKLARKSAPKEDKRQPAKTSAELATALRNLHAAYVKGDDKQISECREKLDALMEKQEPELDNSVVITEEAKGHAAEALKVLNVRQAGAFLATLELTDPTELLLSALEQVRSLKNDKELEQETATVAEEVAWLLHGLDDDETSQQIKEKVTQLLERAYRQKKDPGAGNDSKSLEKDAKEIGKEVDNLDVISHILEHGIAELLSNPRLEAAIRIQSQLAAKSASTKKTGPPKK
jgi:hypothetical protein